MSEEGKAGSKPIGELLELRRRLAELELVDSARRQVEAELRHERDLAQGYLNVVASIIVVLDEQGRVTLINKRGCEILGREENEIVGKSWWEFLPARDRENVKEVFESLMEGKGEDSTYYENYVVNGEGEERLISWHNAVLKDEDGMMAGTLSSGDDITEQQKSEQALRDSEAKMRGVFRVAPIGFGVVSAEREILELNDRCCEILGYAWGELIGKNVRILYESEEEYERVGTERDRQQARGGSASIETRLKCKDGRVIDVIVGLSSFHSGAAINNIFTLQDITESKRIRQRIESLNDLFLSLGSDPVENIRRILEAAKEIMESSHVTLSVLRRGTLLSLTLPGSGDKFKAVSKLEGNVCSPIIEKNSREPMTIYDLNLTEFQASDPFVAKHALRSYLGYPVMVEGRTSGCLSIFGAEPGTYSSEDIEMAGMLAQALSIEQERLERDEALKDFIDIASHELRHPITIIKGYTLSLRELWEDLDRGKREELLEAIELGTDRLNRLALELLDVSRIVRGRFPVSREQILLIPLLEYAVSHFIEKNIRDRCEMTVKREIGSADVDPNRLLDLIHILLDNAARYSPPDSRISIEVDKAGDQIIVSVLDNGIGIPEAYREKVFDRFFQLEDAMHHSKSGLGIGLFVAREIVEAHGGRIWCEGRENQGSAFCFTLPSVPRAQAVE